MKQFTRIDQLTEEQSVFAAEHYPLIHRFLRANRLKEDDFFDVAVFGYLRAVKRYLEREELRRYAFSTIAWRAMRGCVSNFWRSQRRPCRNAVVVSLDRIGEDTELSVYEMLPDDFDGVPMTVEDKLLEAAVLSKLTRRQRKLISMRDEGWNECQISKELGLSHEDMETESREIYRVYELEKRAMD